MENSKDHTKVLPIQTESMRPEAADNCDDVRDQPTLRWSGMLFGQLWAETRPGHKGENVPLEPELVESKRRESLHGARIISAIKADEDSFLGTSVLDPR